MQLSNTVLQLFNNIKYLIKNLITNTSLIKKARFYNNLIIMIIFIIIILFIISLHPFIYKINNKNDEISFLITA